MIYKINFNVISKDVKQLLINSIRVHKKFIRMHPDID
jgi:hypothetical protein